MLQSLFYLTIALHVSGIIVTQLQEHRITVTPVSGNRYAVIDRVKCNFIYYSVTVTRFCSYRYFVLLKMGETCRAIVR
jgi:hypothetical protein